jgi:hypothetical protein
MLFEKEEIELLNGVIPKYERVKPGLITILKAHSETNLSNLLAYIFKGEDYPQLREIFLQSLIDCIDLNTHEDNFVQEMLDDGYAGIKVFSEYQTKSGRIDILIVKESKRQSERAAIIIENKLYHELNNDFDDYFYSVCEDMNVLPKNLALVTLTLKPFDYGFPDYMKSGKIIHSKLKETIEKELGRNGSIKNDRNVIFLVNEYLTHIEDLYVKRLLYSNEKCFKFYSDNRKIINSIVMKVEGLNFEDFDLQLPADKKLLYELKQSIEDLIQLQKNISIYVSESFNNYLTLTERNVQGPGYFRGRGLAFEAIRYKLDFLQHFNSDKGIEFAVWLNGSFLADQSIDIKDSFFEPTLLKLGVKLPNIIEKKWIKIHTDNLEIDNEILTRILRENIDKQWGEFESKLSETIAKGFKDNFNNIVFKFLDSQIGFDHKLIEGSNTIQFAYSTTEAFYQYSIKYSPPDLIEIILYVENTFWEKVEKAISTENGFTKFTQIQSYQLPELKDEQLGGNNRNYDALIKKSYRIKSLDEVGNLFNVEKKIWTKIEKKIVELIDNNKSQKN